MTTGGVARAQREGAWGKGLRPIAQNAGGDETGEWTQLMRTNNESAAH